MLRASLCVLHVQEKRTAYALLRAVLEHAPSATAPADAGLMLYPVLGSLAFGSNAADKAWAAQLLQLLQHAPLPQDRSQSQEQPQQQQQQQQQQQEEEAGSVGHGELCLLQQARRLVKVLWGPQGPALGAAGAAHAAGRAAAAAFELVSMKVHWRRLACGGEGAVGAAGSCPGCGKCGTCHK